MKRLSTASKVLSRSDYDDYKRGTDKSIVKSTTEKIDTIGEKLPIKNAEEALKERNLTQRIRATAKQYRDAGQADKAKELLEKAFKSKNFKKVAMGAGKKLLSALPLIGGVMSAFDSKDASAAVPIFGDSESTGPVKGSPESKLEDPSVSDEERRKIMEKLRASWKSKITNK